MPEPGAASVAPLDHLCWTLQTATGQDYEGGEGVPHYDTYDEAIRRAGELHQQYDAGPMWPVRQPGPCWLVRCGTCDERLHPDYTLHAESREAAVQAASDYEWTVIDGVPFCEWGGCWHPAEEGIDNHAGPGSECKDPACQDAYGTSAKGEEDR